MSGLSDWAEVQSLNAFLRKTALSIANDPYIGLNTSDPTDAANPTELVDSNYIRKQAVFDAPTSGPGQTQNAADILFNAIADAGPFIITHVTIWDSETGGNMLMSQPLVTSKSFSQGDTPRFPQGSLAVTSD